MRLGIVLIFFEHGIPSLVSGRRCYVSEQTDKLQPATWPASSKSNVIDIATY